ncbi:uncharacterized protein TRUGW13939_11986 [Talaromyces rugulosus]|uniref:Glycoside hydrolase family 1 protein n=1 Tax=Talaromyces rugulosus TaxID=121627 RepID=A0A7H8RE95_TALRU|nr:uncharacterized protein TRUGW13939_11986 [Talaromyces rugulosus]QKX64810.1 hypothetical protein TRUGW13939_11986 [Talaromyces rugulosus]
MTETVRTATSVPAPTTTVTYARPFASLVTLAPNVTFTTWGKWDPGDTVTATDVAKPYGQAAWSSLWLSANPPNFTDYTSLYSTTVSPTPVPTEELVLPPPEYFRPTDCYYFPPNFVLGVASSACQIEGATADEGKGPTLMDVLFKDESPKDYVTNEAYYYYKQDIERVAAMGVKYFSFSISWSRILPFALPGSPVNQQGIDHYNVVINFVLKKGMFLITPEIGKRNGAYQNETFVDAFVHYAKIVMTHYADRVPLWITFNEPQLYTSNGMSVYNLIMSHAHVAHFYRDEIQGTGKIGFKFNNHFGVPRDPLSSADIAAADHYNSFIMGPFANPIYLGKDYPESYKSTIHDYVPLTQEKLAYIGGTADYFLVDPYVATVIAPPVPSDEGSIMECATDVSSPFRPNCVNESSVNIYGWDLGYASQSYVYMTPTYIRTCLNWIYNTYRHPIMIGEFGFPVWAEDEKTLANQLYDSPRSNYYLSFLSECLKAIWEDGVDIAGAFMWSYVDNWEFGDYRPHFGLQTVNRTTQERHYKKSFFDIVDYIKARGVQ